MDLPKENCLFAIPKKGRLYEQCEKLLKGAGLDYFRPNRLDVATCKDLPITLVFLPAADIAKYVAKGNVDLGITGQDVVAESQADVDEVMPLGFGACRLSLLAPKTSNITDAKMLVGKRIVTSFPNLSKMFFNGLNASQPTSIEYVSGSVEAACGLGLADAVVDLVETGTTMRAAGLEEVTDVIRTEAVILKNKNVAPEKKKEVERILKRITGYMTATNFMMVSYNVSKSLMSKAIAVTPGKKGPTVSRLDVSDSEEPCVAVSALIPRKKASQIMDELETVGATDILLFSVSNSRM